MKFNPPNILFLSAPHLPSLPPPKKIGFFSELPYQNFSSLTPSHLLKVTKFLVKISQFKFLVMTDKAF